jgi:hypothetical protein
MKKFCLLSLALILFNTSGKAQEKGETKISKHNLYLELGTNYYVSSVSLNFEKYIFSSKSGETNFYGRVGLGGSSVYWHHAGWGGLGGLTMITNSTGSGHFELSGGVFVGYEPSAPAVEGPGDLFVIPLLDLGFRYQKPGNHFIFRAKVGILGIGIGLGYAF